MQTISIPVKTIGPIKIVGPEVNTEVKVPLATFETPMWPSANRGASVTRCCDGLHCLILDDRMTRSILLEGSNIAAVKTVLDDLNSNNSKVIAEVISNTSRFCQSISWHTQVIGNLLFLRLEATTGDASGHNMLTKGADAVIDWMLKKYSQLKYVSISGNICVDKKVSAINGILGRGKYVVVDMIIPFEVCQERLHTTPRAIVDLHIKKNLMGSIISGSVRTANAHFANLLYAIYLATGQDVANIVEGSQGFTHAELRNKSDLYFSVTLPNIIVGTVGSGKHLDFVKQHLRLLGCLDNLEIGQSARRLAIIVAATVWCGELSLLAAQTNPGELMRVHEKFERSKNRTEFKSCAVLSPNKHFSIPTDPATDDGWINDEKRLFENKNTCQINSFR